MKLKPYMGYSGAGGSQEGAFLIFAHNIKEARKIGWPALHNLICDDYIDMRVKFIKDGDYLYDQMPGWSKEKLDNDIPHVVESPPTCTNCDFWGVGPLNEYGYCENCWDNCDFDFETWCDYLVREVKRLTGQEIIQTMEIYKEHYDRGLDPTACAEFLLKAEKAMTTGGV